MSFWYEIENVADVASPALLIYPDRVLENLKRMIAMAGGDAARLRPHVKTHKLPQIIRMKRSLGIERFKTSTIAEAEMTAMEGGQDVLLAYQPVGPNVVRLAKLIQRFPQTRFSALVDNEWSLEEISKGAIEHGVEVNLFVDLNVGMNRTGIVPGEAAVRLYSRVCNTCGIAPAGVHAYDGHLHNANFVALTSESNSVFSSVLSFIERLDNERLPVPHIVAGGTPTSSLLLKHPKVEVGAGTTVLWDFGQAETSPDLNYLNAAVLLARVISRPTSDRLCLDVGHKAVASEMAQPRVRWFGLENAEVVMHSEEHLVLRIDNAEQFAVGTVLYGIPRHICPTVALHNEVGCVRDGRVVERWPVTARARCLTI